MLKLSTEFKFVDNVKHLLMMGSALYWCSGAKWLIFFHPWHIPLCWKHYSY